MAAMLKRARLGKSSSGSSSGPGGGRRATAGGAGYVAGGGEGAPRDGGRDEIRGGCRRGVTDDDRHRHGAALEDVGGGGAHGVTWARAPSCRRSSPAPDRASP